MARIVAITMQIIASARSKAKTLASSLANRQTISSSSRVRAISWRLKTSSKNWIVHVAKSSSRRRLWKSVSSGRDRSGLPCTEAISSIRGRAMVIMPAAPSSIRSKVFRLRRCSSDRGALRASSWLWQAHRSKSPGSASPVSVPSSMRYKRIPMSTSSRRRPYSRSTIKKPKSASVNAFPM